VVIQLTPRRRMALVRDAALSRPVSVHGMGEKYAGADNAEKRSNCFHHDHNPKAQRGRPNCTSRYTVKRFPVAAGFLKAG
jgi:hypothetical protein